MNSETLLAYLQSLPRDVLEDHYIWMLDTLTTTQTRCTELLTEVRDLKADLQKSESELVASRKDAAGWKESYRAKLKNDLHRAELSKELDGELLRLTDVESDPFRWVVMCSAPGMVLGYWRGDFGSKEEAQALIDVYSKRTTTNYSMTPVPLTPQIESYARLSPDDGLVGERTGSEPSYWVVKATSASTGTTIGFMSGDFGTEQDAQSAITEALQRSGGFASISSWAGKNVRAVLTPVLVSEIENWSSISERRISEHHFLW